MPQQKIMNESTYNDLLEKLEEKEQLNIYDKGEEFTEFFEKDLLLTTINVQEEAPKLVISGSKPEKNDAENAIRVYEYLPGLSRVQAADSRLWATLTHTTFWNYCRARWPNSSDKVDYVREHWFEIKSRGLGALRRNAISRLWWAAHLTVAPWEHSIDFDVFKSKDRYKYTRILLAQQQTFQDTFERNYGSNLKLRICLLDALGRFHEQITNKDIITKSAVKQLTLLLKSRKVDTLSVEDLRQVMDELVGNVVQRMGKKLHQP
jgi:hypothetical protein